ncbi:MAG: hypothetical protein H9872_06605, partial [Candidatus Cellulosilyticum pullistercoris]|nr:hypothetical protein [Candidatus Cellulosilyticum pullistercoris]
MKKVVKTQLKKRVSVVLTGAMVVSASVPSLGNMMEAQKDEVRDLPYSVLYNETEIERSTSGALELQPEQNNEVQPEQNKTYTYEFGNLDKAAALGLPTIKGELINKIVTPDGLLTINGDNKMSHNGDKHGLIVKDGNSFEVKVAGNAIITFGLCPYSNGGKLIVSAPDTNNGEFSSEDIDLKVSTDGEEVSLIYVGEPTTLTFKVADLSGQGYIHSLKVENTSEDLSITQWKQKNFSISIGDVEMNLQGAASEKDQAQAEVTNGDVYYAQSEKAYVSLNLEGNALTGKDLTNNSPETVENLEVNENGDIVVTFKDKTTNPATYTIKVQDTSQFVTPKVSDIYSFDYAKSEIIPHDFSSDNPIKEEYTTDNGILTLGKGTGTKSPYWHDNAHGLALNDGNTIDVVVAGDAEITFNVCVYGSGGTLIASNLAGTGSFDSDQMKSEVDNTAITYTYKGEATTLRFTLASQGEAYLHSMTVRNTGKLVGSDVANEQKSMPIEIDSSDSLTVTPVGQKLEVVHSNKEASISSLNNVGYYVFSPSQDTYSIEADIKIEPLAGGGSNGLFIGMFDDQTPITLAATLGFRGDGTVRNTFTKAGQATVSAGGINTKYVAGENLHVVIKKTADGWYSEFTQGNNDPQTKLYKFTDAELLKTNGVDTNVRFGFAFSNVQATITNLIFKDSADNVLYDQTDCYDAIGTPPTITEVDEPVISQDRTTIRVSWKGDNVADDAA